MNRRKFLGYFGSAVALSVVVPSGLSAEDYRKLKPKVWEAKKVDDAIKELFGSTEMIEKDVKLKLPKVASNGGAVPVKFSTKIPAKTVAVFQDANPESAVVVYDVGKYDITQYSIKIKMGQSGTVTVVVEGLDGKLYVAKQSLEVAAGGCEG
ncbi:MAG: thiosulfate oxidation carrier protein SoxY [Campylobacterota bacterium]|nr:thiosulfate oxidation carrier protein SoxY [Campylobacterota bacterium]